MQSIDIVPDLPVAIPLIMGFIAHLHNTGLAPASIISTISAIAYFHKLNGYQDPSKNFIVSKMLTGAKNLCYVSDVRLPVTLPILTRLIQVVPIVITNTYKSLMLRTMMVLAFQAYLRVGEMVPRSGFFSQWCLQLRDVSIQGELITVSFRHFKHSGRQGPQCLHINGDSLMGTSICPVTLLTEFIRARGPLPAPFFAYPDGTLMLRREFDVLLKRVLTFCGLSSKLYKGHSFRVGAATESALRGKSDAYIRAAGRWSSDAFRKYIRIS